MHVEDDSRMINVPVQQANTRTQAAEALWAVLRGDKAQVDSLVQLLATVASEETNKASGDGGMAQP